MDVARDGPKRGTGASWSSAAPATASRASAARACRWPCSAIEAWHDAARAAGVAVLYIHGLNPWGFSLVAADDARERRPEPELPRLRRRGAGQRRLRRARRPPSCPTTWPADAAARGQRSMPSSPRTARARCRRRSPAASTATPTASSSAAPRRPGATGRCARCCASTAARCRRAGLDRPAHRTRPERPRRAHLRRPRRRRGHRPRRAPGGATSPRSTTARRARRS